MRAIFDASALFDGLPDALLDEVERPRPPQRPAPGKVSRTACMASGLRSVQRQEAVQRQDAVQRQEHAGGGGRPAPGEIRYELPIHTVTFGPPGPQVAAHLASATATYARLGIRVVHASAMQMPVPPPQADRNAPPDRRHPLDREEASDRRPDGSEYPRALDQGTPELSRDIGMTGHPQHVPAQASDELRRLLADRAAQGQISVYWIPVEIRSVPHEPPDQVNAMTYDHAMFPNVHPDEEGIVIEPGASADVLSHELGHILMRIGHTDLSTAEERAHPNADVQDPSIPRDNVMYSGTARTGTEFTDEQLERLYASRYLRPVAGARRDRPAASGWQIQQATAETTTPGLTPAQVHATAEHGVGGASGRLPFIDAIAGSFGRHDVSDVRVAIGGAAADASQTLGAHAYATGDAIGFARAPDLHLAAHEAAHIVQQRAGIQLADGIGRAGDDYERHADEVADLVVRGASAEAALDRFAGGRADGGGAVQRHAVQASGDPVAAAKRAFMARVYRQPNYQPPPSNAFDRLGGFDVTYTPTSGVLLIECRCAFFFTGAWPPGQSEVWRQRFITERSRDWSGHHQFQCTRQGWDDVRANTTVQFVDVGNDRPQFIVTVSWLPPGQEDHRTAEVTRNPADDHAIYDPYEEQMHNTRPMRPGTVELDSNDNDPNVNGQVPGTHEGGHMLGLDDEYEEEEGTPRHSNLVEHDLGHEVVRNNDDRVMSAGMRVDPEHGVTFLAALRAATHMQEWGFANRLGAADAQPAPAPLH